MTADGLASKCSENVISKKPLHIPLFLESVITFQAEGGAGLTSYKLPCKSKEAKIKILIVSILQKTGVYNFAKPLFSVLTEIGNARHHDGRTQYIISYEQLTQGLHLHRRHKKHGLSQRRYTAYRKRRNRPCGSEAGPPPFPPSSLRTCLSGWYH